MVSSLRLRLEALGEAVFESTLPCQALHGDVSLSNLPSTPQCLVWNDFEDTFRGAVHWTWPATPRVSGFVARARASSENA